MPAAPTVASHASVPPSSQVRAPLVPAARADLEKKGRRREIGRRKEKEGETVEVSREDKDSEYKREIERNSGGKLRFSTG